MIKIEIDRVVYDVEVLGDKIVIEFENDEGYGDDELIFLNKDIVYKICELIPNEITAKLIEDKQRAEREAANSYAKMREAMRRVLKAEGELAKVEARRFRHTRISYRTLG
ncbi:hypothetical protein LCGC14_2896840 [marine sediment metagenome]|uniref:Uncharacterized protein n=1 Tax=marine sediment metagenome TaxID=412755 RepID=A0A0F8XVZ5_9ZZZZ